MTKHYAKNKTKQNLKSQELGKKDLTPYKLTYNGQY